MNHRRCLAEIGIAVLVLVWGVLQASEPGAKGGYNVREYGAAGDGKSLDSPAINRAIAACATAGGGTEINPAGTYLCGSLHLANNLHLFLDAGAVLLGAPQSLGAYDETESFPSGAYQDGGHCYFHNSLIWGENLTNVFITGHGMINGGSLERDPKIVDDMCGYKHFGTPNTTNYPPVRIGNKAIALKLCRNVVIRPGSVLITSVSIQQATNIQLIGSNFPTTAKAPVNLLWRPCLNRGGTSWLTHNKVVGDRTFNGMNGRFTNVIVNGASGASAFFWLQVP